jgi:acetyl esterase/lipase
LIQGNDLFPEGYTPDEIDQVDDRVAAPAMIYPALTFNYNKSMLLCLFDADAVRDEGIRQEYLALVDLKNHVENSAKLPQFIAWGTKDTMVGTRGTAAYIEAAKAAGVAVTEVIAEGQEHGFAQEYYMNQYLDWVMEIFELNS